MFYFQALRKAYIRAFKEWLFLSGFCGKNYYVAFVLGVASPEFEGNVCYRDATLYILLSLLSSGVSCCHYSFY